MFDFVKHLFDTSGFPARWNCGSWTPGHGWLHIVSDLAVWSAYFAIPCILVYFVLRRRDVPFPSIFWLFGAFILACGTTHLMEAIIFWHPVYRLAGVIKLITAIVSWGTVVALVPIVPRALAVRSPEELDQEIAARKKAEDALQRANAELETRVLQRTADLAQANAALRESQRREKERADEMEALLGELRRNQEILKLVHQIAKIGHWEWNSLTDENKWSPEIEALYGLPPGGFEGSYQAWAKLIHPDDLPKAEEDVRRAFQTGKYFTEFRVIWPDGNVHWLEARANVFKDDHDKPVRIMGVNMDVTERKEADRRKDEFLATLAHELRNPLAPLRTAVELVRRAGDDVALLDKARHMMDRQVGQMVRLVDELLDISRITRGKIRLRKERVDLAAVIQSVVEESRSLLEAQAHELTVTLPPQPTYLEADPTRLGQVFSNLLNNAAKYTEKGGHIWLTAERQNGEVVISVRDTGIGIAPEQLAHVFEIFSQLAPALERSQGGLGIGLALVHGLVELHGGRVEAHSAGPGKGSAFVVRLPVVDRPAAVPPGPLEEEKPRAESLRRILVVDDNRDAADSLVIMLRMMGHETHTAYDGQEAVQAAPTFRPDVIFLDIGMPKMNGYEVARQIRQQPWGKDMALIALTGWGQEEDKRRAQEAGFDHHLTKPVEAEALMKLLARINPVPPD